MKKLAIHRYLTVIVAVLLAFVWLRPANANALFEIPTSQSAEAWFANLDDGLSDVILNESRVNNIVDTCREYQLGTLKSAITRVSIAYDNRKRIHSDIYDTLMSLNDRLNKHYPNTENLDNFIKSYTSDRDIYFGSINKLQESIANTMGINCEQTPQLFFRGVNQIIIHRDQSQLNGQNMSNTISDVLVSELDRIKQNVAQGTTGQ